MHFPKTYCKNFTFFVRPECFSFFRFSVFTDVVFFFCFSFFSLAPLTLKLILYQKRTNSDEKVKGVQFIRVGTIQFDTLVVWFGLV